MPEDRHTEYFQWDSQVMVITNSKALPTGEPENNHTGTKIPKLVKLGVTTCYTHCS
jgi:hypothetical protein